mmetsp:Transcript_14520/g.24191  ORF Transcript_14520/g.24191 Transcript_14520/m.24191 type:complete len:311 (-) Transcript_14520:384-1316(-)
MTSTPILIGLLLLTSSASAFTIPLPFLSAVNAPSNPLLIEYAETTSSNELNLRLDIGKFDSDVRLPVDNLCVRLDTSARPDRGENGEAPHPVPLPGADGPNPGLSSGPMTLDIVESGNYVTLDGSQSVPLTDGSWEIVWRYGNPAGSIIFAMRVSHDIKRNEATLPGGRVYVSYPLWTIEGIAEAREYVADVQNKAEQYKTERDDAINRAKDTANPLMKALHYREAFAAQERLDFSGIRTVEQQQVPDDSDLIAIGNSSSGEDDVDKRLLLCRQGTVWTKDGNFFGGEHELLGSSTVRSVSSAASEELKP